MNESSAQIVVPVGVLVAMVLATNQVEREKLVDIARDTCTFGAPAITSDSKEIVLVRDVARHAMFVHRETPFEGLLYAITKELYTPLYTDEWETYPDYHSLPAVNEHDLEIKATNKADFEKFVFCVQTLYLISQYLSQDDQTNFQDWLRLAWNFATIWSSVTVSDEVQDNNQTIYNFSLDLSRIALTSKAMEYDEEEFVECYEGNLKYIANKLILEGLHDLPFGQDSVREKIMNAIPKLAALAVFEEKQPQFWQYIMDDDSFFSTPHLNQIFQYLIMHLGLYDQDLILQ